MRVAITPQQLMSSFWTLHRPTWISHWCHGLVGSVDPQGDLGPGIPTISGRSINRINTEWNHCFAAPSLDHYHLCAISMYRSIIILFFKIEVYLSPRYPAIWIPALLFAFSSPPTLASFLLSFSPVFVPLSRRGWYTIPILHFCVPSHHHPTWMRRCLLPPHDPTLLAPPHGNHSLLQSRTSVNSPGHDP
jgi:hypothetical protein